MPSIKMQKRIDATRKRGEEAKERALRAFDNARKAEPGQGMVAYEICEEGLEAMAVAMEQLGRETNARWERPKELFTLIGVDPAQAKAVLQTQCTAAMTQSMSKLLREAESRGVLFSNMFLREEYSRFVNYAKKLGLDAKSDEQMQKAGIDTERLAFVRTQGKISPEGYYL